MKKITIILASLAIFAGCAKETAKNDEAANNELVEYTFYASINDADVKSSLDNTGHFSWTAGTSETGDKIAIYDNTSGTYKTFYVESVTSEGVATIKGSAHPNADFSTAIYPAAVAAGSGNGINYASGIGSPVLVADATESELFFRYLGAVMNITVIGAPEAVTKLTLTTENYVFGSVQWFSMTPNPHFSDFMSPVNSVTVPFAGAGNITSIAVPDNDLGHFTITLSDNNGRNYYQKTTSGTFNLTGKKLLPMPELQYEPASKFYVTTVSPSQYWDKSAVRMLQTGANAYEVQMNADGASDVYIFDEYNIDNFTEGYLDKGQVGDGNFYKISWNSSTNTGGPAFVSTTRDYPFYSASYPVDQMAISGEFNDWSYNTDLFTYNGNHCWTCEDLNIASDGSYKFKIRKAESAWSYPAGQNSGLSDVLYGSLKGDQGDAIVNLTAGKYNVYLNSTSDWYYNIMFEKQ